MRKQLHYLHAVTSNANHSICGSPWTVHREDQWKEARCWEETVALMIRNEAPLCPWNSTMLPRIHPNTCRWVAGTRALQTAFPPGLLGSACLSGCQLLGQHRYLSENSVPIKRQDVFPLNCRETKPVNSTFDFFFFFPPEMVSGVEETEQH